VPCITLLLVESVLVVAKLDALEAPTAMRAATATRAVDLRSDVFGVRKRVMALR